MAAEGSFAPPAVGVRENVHVTGRRILATLVDGLVLGVLYTLMTALLFLVKHTDAEETKLSWEEVTRLCNQRYPR